MFWIALATCKDPCRAGCGRVPTGDESSSSGLLTILCMYGSKLGPNAEKKVRDQIMRTLGWRKAFWSRKPGQLASHESAIHQNPNEERKSERALSFLYSGSNPNYVEQERKSPMVKLSWRRKHADRIPNPKLKADTGTFGRAASPGQR